MRKLEKPASPQPASNLDENEISLPTVRDLFHRYERDFLPRLAKTGQRDARRYFKVWIIPHIGSKNVTDVTFADCELIHRRASEKTPTTANRVLATLRRCLNLAVRWGWIKRNPAIGIELNSENQRDRFLNSVEIDRLLKALDEHPRRDSADAIKMMLFTGCRRSEALSARWEQFDAGFKVWTKPASNTKQRRRHRVPLSKAVAILLKKRQSQLSESESPFVFPSRTGTALKEVRRTWARVLKEAGIEGFRLHDLRHTFASLAVSKGNSLPVIGALLGHTQTQTTARYAHLYDAPLLEAAEQVSQAITERTRDAAPRRKPMPVRKTQRPAKVKLRAPKAKIR